MNPLFDENHWYRTLHWKFLCSWKCLINGFAVSVEIVEQKVMQAVTRPTRVRSERCCV